MRKFAIILSVILLGSFTALAQDTVRIAFIGDVMCHQRQLEYAYDSSSKSYNFDSYFAHIKPFFERADFAVANMEFTVGVTPYTGYPCFSAPAELPLKAKEAGIDLFMMANNHICDKGKRGLDSTMAIYSRLQVPHIGAYASDSVEVADNPYLVNIRGINVAFLNFTYGTNGISVPSPYRVNKLDSLHIRQTIARAKERGAEFIIAMPHWGEEYSINCNQSQRKWEAFLYREGVNAVIGSHPHVVQEVEYGAGRFTVFSMGNFISNMSIKFGQIGMLVELVLTVDDEKVLDVLPPEVTYLWCGRGGLMEKNYSVVPIRDYLDSADHFLVKAQHQKMVREWNELVKKLNIE
ncbi:MAG: CapA family protein [Bacteroidales bacterium]|nr:CapA family protein [Bacteroidales bacterium]